MCLLRNRSMKTVISKSYELCDDFFSRARGLMFRRSFERPLIFIFPNESRLNAIHSFFVFFEFDAVFLDARKRVVDVRERVRPFTPFIVPSRPAKYLIEMPAGMGRKVAVGDVLEF